jgi:ABC-2 type transport system ATP-binding protein
MEKAIEAISLTKKFNLNIAVNNLSFSVYKGEIFGFLGPNGAGKTTTLRMLTGLLIPDKGQSLINGIDISKEPIRAKLDIGVIPEMGNIYLDLTAKQNIILAGKFYGINSSELISRTENLLKIFQLQDRENDIAKNFSKGMKQRINIASALVHEPKILFIDEPTSGLDVISQRLIKKVIRDINKKGSTIFLTTHDMEEANNLCNRVAIINKGSLVAIDKPEILRLSIEAKKTVVISFDKDIDISPFLNKEHILGIEKVADKFNIQTDNPDIIIKDLVDIAKKYDLKITMLEILKASLEDVFLKFTREKD